MITKESIRHKKEVMDILEISLFSSYASIEEKGYLIDLILRNVFADGKIEALKECVKKFEN